VSNPYEVLGVAETADADTIRRAFHRLAQAEHPDRNPGREAEATRTMQRLSAAWNVLSDTQARQALDARLSRIRALRRHVRGARVGPEEEGEEVDPFARGPVQGRGLPDPFHGGIQGPYEYSVLLAPCVGIGVAMAAAGGFSGWGFVAAGAVGTGVGVIALYHPVAFVLWTVWGWRWVVAELLVAALVLYGRIPTWLLVVLFVWALLGYAHLRRRGRWV
jgi:hypothetical protein